MRNMTIIRANHFVWDCEKKWKAEKKRDGYGTKEWEAYKKAYEKLFQFIHG